MNYIVAVSDGLYCFYYRDGGVWFCEFKNGAWSETQVLISGVRKDFTVNLIDEEIILIWQDDAGDLKKGRFSGDDITAHVLISGKGELGQYCAISAEGGLNLVYSLPFSGDIHMLMSQLVGTNGAWGAVKRVDNISAMSGFGSVSLFRLVPVADRHYLAVYQNGGFESRIGYKEIYGDEVGKYNLIHSSIHSFGDCSFLATKYDLHVACVVRGVFGARLIYKKKGADGFSPGVVVTEGQGLHNVMFYTANEKLHLLFMRNDNIYCVVAEDNGYRWSFLPLEEHTHAQPRQISKAIFLSNNRSKIGIMANELLVDKEKPWEIQSISRHVFEAYTQQKTKIQVQTKNNTKNAEDDYNEFFNNMENELTEFLDNSH